MTTQQTNSILTKLRTATASLAEYAIELHDFAAYVRKAAEALTDQWSSLASPTIIEDENLDQSTITTHSLINSAQGQFAQLLLKANYQRLVVEFSLAEPDMLWEPLQLWAQIVAQVWQANPQDDMREQLHLYRGLSLIAQRVSRELASERVLEEACQSIIEAMPAIDHVALIINENAPISGTIYAEYPDYGNRSTLIPLTDFPVHERMNDTLAPLVIQHFDRAKELMGVGFDMLNQIGVKSAIILPLVVQKSLIGSIILSTRQVEHQFSPLEIEILEIIATQIAIGIHNAELFEEVSSRIVSEALTSRVTERLPLRADFNTLMQTAARELGQVIGAQQAHIYLNEEYLNPDQEASAITTTTDER